MSEDEAERPDFQVGRVLGRMLSVARAHWWRLAVILVLLVLLPQLAKEAWLIGTGRAFSTWASMALAVVALLGQLAVTIVSLETSQGRPVTLRGVLSGAWTELPAMVGISVIQALGIGLGFILLIVPGFYAMAALAVALPLHLVAGGGIVKSLRESPHMTEGARWPILGTILLVTAMGAVTSYLIYSLGKLLPEAQTALFNGFVLEPAGQMLWVLANGLAAPAIFHELWWGAEAGPDEEAAEVFD